MSQSSGHLNIPYLMLKDHHKHFKLKLSIHTTEDTASHAFKYLHNNLHNFSLGLGLSLVCEAGGVCCKL